MHKSTSHKHVKPNWWDFGRAAQTLYQKYMEVPFQLKPADTRIKIIGQKRVNFYRKLWGKWIFKHEISYRINYLINREA